MYICIHDVYMKQNFGGSCATQKLYTDLSEIIGCNILNGAIVNYVTGDTIFYLYYNNNCSLRSFMIKNYILRDIIYFIYLNYSSCLFMKNYSRTSQFS